MKHIDDIIKANGPATHKQNESNDCTVMALSATFEISYDQAHAFATRKWNRGRGEGVSSLKLVDTFGSPKALETELFSKKVYRVEAIKEYRQPSGYMRERAMTLSTFCKEYPKGRYYILVRGHALAIIDGEIVDHTNKPKRKIVRAWKVIE